MSIEEQVLAETERFHAALPEIMKKHAGRWVVFREGVVASAHDDQDQAYSAGVAEFGIEGGFVVAQVAEVTPTPITAAVMFG